MANILVADMPDSDRRLSAILAGHQVTFVRTLEKALLTLARGGFDLLMIGVHFDDSRMFELLRQVRGDERYANLPTACVRSYSFVSPTISIEGLEIAARALNASLLLDLTRFPDDAAGNAALRKQVDALLS